MRTKRRAVEKGRAEPSAGLLRRDDAGDNSDGLRVTYARSLDGQGLWLAVDGRADELELLARGSGVAIRLEEVAEVVVGERTEACASLDSLWELLGQPPGLDVVIANRGLPVPPAHTATIGDNGSITRSPTCHGWRTEVTTSDGTVRVVRVKAEVGSRVRGFSMSELGVHVHFDTDLDGPEEVVMCSPSGARIGAIPVHRDGSDGLTFTVGSDSGLQPGLLHHLLVGSSSHTLPLVRDPDDVKRPGAAVALPRLWTSHHDRVQVIRFRYVQGGRLAVEAIPADDEKDPA